MHRKGCNEEGDKRHTPQRRRRKLNQGEALALDQPVEKTSKREVQNEGKKGSWAEGKKNACKGNR
jgi:hypothetical protein